MNQTPALQGKRVTVVGLARYAYRAIKKRTDAAEYGGAPLLGVNGVCIIGHGSSSSRAVYNGIRVAGESISHKVNAQIESLVEAIKG